jgi:chemotaxis-related protein WspB
VLILTFTVGTNRYAVEVARVIELVPRVELRSIPHAPAFLAGLLDYRGRVVPVVDLGLLLGSHPCQDRLSTRIILVNDAPIDHNRQKGRRVDTAVDAGHPPSGQDRDHQLIGLIAEQVSDLTEVRPEQVVASPVYLPQTPYLGAIAQTDSGMVPLLELAKLSLVINHGSLVISGST